MQFQQSTEVRPEPSFSATPPSLGSIQHSVLHSTHLFPPHLHHPNFSYPSTPPARSSRLCPLPTHCSYSWNHQQVPAPVQLCTGHSRSRGKQTRAPPCRNRTWDITQLTQLQQSPRHSGGSHEHVIKSNWIPDSFSSLPDYPEAIQSGLNKDMYIQLLSL